MYETEFKAAFYVRTDGLLANKADRGRAKKDGIACRPMPNGYRLVKLYIGGKSIARCAHRVVWLIRRGGWPSSELDHRDDNRANNRLRNLRLATRAKNTAKRKMRQRALPRGVTWAGHTNKANPYLAQCGNKYVGYFATPAQAHEAFKTRHLEIYGKEWNCG